MKPFKIVLCVLAAGLAIGLAIAGLAGLLF